MESTLKVCDTDIATPLYSNREVVTSKHESTGGNLYGSDLDHRQKAPAPPRQLLSLPPLAWLVNAFLIGLDELRRCFLACAFPELRTYFRKDFLEKVKQLLVQNVRAVLTPGFLNMKGEDAGKLRSVAVELKEEFETCVEPDLTGALEVALGSFDNIPARPAHNVETEEEVEVETGECVVTNETSEEENFDEAKEERDPEVSETDYGEIADEQVAEIAIQEEDCDPAKVSETKNEGESSDEQVPPEIAIQEEERDPEVSETVLSITCNYNRKKVFLNTTYSSKSFCR